MSDFNRLSIKFSVVDLAAKCRQLTVYRRELAVRRSRGEENPTILWDDGKPVSLAGIYAKRATRRYCSRYHQLAYAFARGKNYAKVEATAGRDNTPSSFVIAEILAEHVVGPAPESLKITLEPFVRAWLAGQFTHQPHRLPPSTAVASST
jgi:hypothetical protein